MSGSCILSRGCSQFTPEHDRTKLWTGESQNYSIHVSYIQYLILKKSSKPVKKIVCINEKCPKLYYQKTSQSHQGQL